MIQCSPLLMRVVALAFGALLAVSPASHAEDYSDMCRYYSGQAFKDRQTRDETTFRMNLAQDCVDALIYARSDDPAARERARGYLAQLAHYRQVMIAMLVERAEERDGAGRKPGRHVRPAVQPVSWAGAYLIARRMGVVDTHLEWTEWRRSAAVADPRFRLE